MSQLLTAVKSDHGPQLLTSNPSAATGLAQRTEQVDHVKSLQADLTTLRAELSALRAKRTPAERVTLEEAYTLLDKQDAQISAHGPRMAELEAMIKAEKGEIRARKVAVDRVAQARREMERELRERDLKGSRDERAEEGCRWSVPRFSSLRFVESARAGADEAWWRRRITNTTALYSSLLGIRNAYALGSPPTAMVIEYDSLSGEAEVDDVRTLSIELGEKGEMVGAHVSFKPSLSWLATRAWTPS